MIDMDKKYFPLFMPDSLAACSQAYEDACRVAPEKYKQYTELRDEFRTHSPAFKQWIKALENQNLTGAIDPKLWQVMLKDDLIRLGSVVEPFSRLGVFQFEILSPKIVAVLRRDGAGSEIDSAFTRVKACLRRDAIGDSPVVVPESWTEPALVDTELFELPPHMTPDLFDDREKIHVIYLAGLRNGGFQFKPVYIGVGTGEPYGLGPKIRTSSGRFRFYRYDVKDNFHLEYIRVREFPCCKVENAHNVPSETSIKSDRATLVLGANSPDLAMICLSDPNYHCGFERWLAENPVNRVVFQRVVLEPVRYDLRSQCSDIGFAPDDVSAVLEYAFRYHRWFFVAWQHPDRLTHAKDVLRYYRELPIHRRRECEALRFRPEVLGVDPMVADNFYLSIPDVLGDEELRAALEQNLPGARDYFISWLLQQVSQDLYHFGNHPELRLCTAIALWFRLHATGTWDDAVRAAYEERLFEFNRFSNSSCLIP
jgi:hypothetical protein